jgi:hypothetical protein
VRSFFRPQFRVWTGLGVAALAAVAIGLLAGADPGAAQSTDPCTTSNYGSNYPEFYHGPTGTPGDAYRKYIFDYAVRQSGYGDQRSNCPTEIEISDEGGNTYAFAVPSSGAATAHRITFAAPSECKVAQVQHQVSLGRATRQVDCVGSALIVHITTASAYAQRQVPEDSCTTAEVEMSHCAILTAVVKKDSKTARASRDTITVKLHAITSPTASASRSGEGALTLTIVKKKLDLSFPNGYPCRGEGCLIYGTRQRGFR